jgi:hypothetical protein
MAEAAGRRALLLHLADALRRLAASAVAPEEVGTAVCALAPKAEELARQARLLAYGGGRGGPEAMRLLAAGTAALSHEAAAAAAQAAAALMMGRGLSEAITGQAARLVETAARPEVLASPAALRGAVAPLPALLGTVPALRAATRAAGAAVAGLAARARGFAEEATCVRRGPAAAGQDTDLRTRALHLSRALADFAEEAVRVAAQVNEVGADPEVAPRAAAAEREAPADSLDARIARILDAATAGDGDGSDATAGLRPG